MQKGDIVTVITFNGEFVGRVKNVDPLTLENPRMIIGTEEGKIGFAKGIAASGEIDPSELTINNYTFVTPTNEVVQEGWTTHTGSIVAPNKKKVIVSK